MKDLEQYSEEQIINGIVNNDHSMIEYFFFKKCKSLFASPKTIRGAKSKTNDSP